MVKEYLAILISQEHPRASEEYAFYVIHSVEVGWNNMKTLKKFSPGKGEVVKRIREEDGLEGGASADGKGDGQTAAQHDG